LQLVHIDRKRNFAMKIIKYFIVFALVLSTFHLDAQIIKDMEEKTSSGSSGNNNRESESGDIFIDILYNLDFIFDFSAGVLFGFYDQSPMFASAEEGGIEFAKYPYNDPKGGLYLQRGYYGKRSRTNINLHFLNNENDLYGGYGQIKYSPIPALTLDLSHLRLVEKLNGEAENFDHLGFTTFSINLNRVRHRNFHWWWGMGAMNMDGEENHTGFALNTGMTVYIKKPISLHGEVQSGWLNGAPTSLFQGRLQVHLDRYKVYAGYQGINVDGFWSNNWALGAGVYF